MTKKLKIDISTAHQLEALREANNWTTRQLYLYYLGEDPNGDVYNVDPHEYDAFRKHIERKKNRQPHEAFVANVIEDKSYMQTYSDLNINYKLEDDEIQSADGSITVQDEEVYESGLFNDPSEASKFLFTKFKLDPNEFEVVGYRPTYISKTGQFRIQASFKRRLQGVYDESAVVARYTKLLEKIGSLDFDEIIELDRDNVLVINLADIHWYKMPHIGYSSTYLEDFEEAVYEEVRKIMERAKHTPINRAILTIGHDFFQVNDSRGTTKKGTPVSNIPDYRTMFDTGVSTLANVMAMVAQKYVVDAYYVMANHDEDASWHASRELKLMFRDVGSVNVIVDSNPYHYVEWGSTLIELVHENLKGGKSSSKMHVIASEAWGRTKYRYSIGGHLHGEYATKEANGIVTMGSRALSDSDSWHVLNGYVGNLRGLQAYVFNKDEGLIVSYYANL